MIRFLAIFFTFFIISSAEARLKNINEATAKYNFYNSNLYVNKDGTYIHDIEYQIEIMKDSARDIYGTIYQNYMPAHSQIEILEAKTILNDKEYHVEKDKIEDKSVASMTTGFDESNNLMIAFPKVEVGSKIYLKYRIKHHKPLIDNHFEGSFFFGFKEIFEKTNLKITSEIPLNLLVNDHSKSLIYYNETKDNIQTINVIQNDTIYYDLTDESTIYDNNNATYVSVSSFNNYEEIGNIFAPSFDKVVNQELPPLFEEIYQESKKYDNLDDLINFISISLNKKLRYMGDWRSVGGKFYPQDLSIVESNGYGDCKNFSSSMAAILNKSGYKAHVALVKRSWLPQIPFNSLSSPADFNHAIVYMQDKSGAEYWLDPTNTVSIGTMIFRDIEGRKALILDSNKPKLGFIPLTDADFNKTIVSSTLEDLGENTKYSGNIIFKGASAVFPNTVALDMSVNMIEDMFARNLFPKHKILEKKMSFSENFPSRAIKDVKIDYQLLTSSSLIKSNYGKAYNLKNDNLYFLYYFKDDSEGIFLTNGIETQQKEIFFPNKKIHNVNFLNYILDTKWFKFERIATTEENGVRINMNLVIKVNYFTPNDYRSQEFKDAIQNLISNHEVIAILEEKNI